MKADKREERLLKEGTLLCDMHTVLSEAVIYDVMKALMFTKEFLALAVENNVNVVLQ